MFHLIINAFLRILPSHNYPSDKNLIELITQWPIDAVKYKFIIYLWITADKFQILEIIYLKLHV